MKILSIVLYLLTAAVITLAILDISSLADFSEQDRKAVVLAADQMQTQIDRLESVRLRKYNYLDGKIKACETEDDFKTLSQKLVLTRAVSFNANEPVNLLSAQIGQQKGLFSLDEKQVKQLEDLLKTNTDNFSRIANRAYTPAFPYKSEVLDKNISLSSINKSDVAFWQLSKYTISTYGIEIEQNLLDSLIGAVCESAPTPRIGVRFDTDSKVIAPGTPYEARMLLGTNYFTHTAKFVADQGELIKNEAEKSATLRIQAAADEDDFDEYGKAYKTWHLTLKVPTIAGYKTFELSRTFTVKK